MTKKKKIEKAFLKTKIVLTPAQQIQLDRVRLLLKKKVDGVTLNFQERTILNIFYKRKEQNGKIIDKIKRLDKE